MKFALIAATLAAAALAGCVSNPPKDPMAKDAAPYLEKPDYDYALVCDLRHDDLRKCEATLKQLCGERGYIDLRVRPLRSQALRRRAPRTACCRSSARRAESSASRLSIHRAPQKRFGVSCRCPLSYSLITMRRSSEEGFRHAFTPAGLGVRSNFS
jgi:predicted small lipoprotein YifL